jgi:coenzyme PQQ precursor peptide PqqA
MFWKTPKIVEFPVGMEINMYACAARNTLASSETVDREHGVTA